MYGTQKHETCGVYMIIYVYYLASSSGNAEFTETMQLDQKGHEGIDGSKHTQVVQSQQQHKREEEFDMEKYLKNHGVSNQAYYKMARDVASGDINKKMLMDCDDNELNDIADGFRPTWLQKKHLLRL